MTLWIGIAAGILLLTPMLFSFLKRSAASANPRSWFAYHVAASSLGAALALVHSGGHFGSPPALLLLLLVMVIALGVWIRWDQGSRFASRMGARPLAFASGNPSMREQLQAVLADKTALLSRLDPDAREAEFSPLPRHWLSSPVLAFRYFRLMELERNLTGVRADAGPVLSWSRRLHIALGTLFLVGLMVHVAVALYRLRVEGSG